MVVITQDFHENIHPQEMISRDHKLPHQFSKVKSGSLKKNDVNDG